MRIEFFLITLALCGCSQPQIADRVEQDRMERQALIASMKDHPSMKQGQAGPPIDVPTTIPPKPTDADEHDHDGHLHDNHAVPAPDPSR